MDSSLSDMVGLGGVEFSPVRDVERQQLQHPIKLGEVEVYKEVPTLFRDRNLHRADHEPDTSSNYTSLLPGTISRRKKDGAGGKGLIRVWKINSQKILTEYKPSVIHGKS